MAKSRSSSDSRARALEQETAEAFSAILSTAESLSERERLARDLYLRLANTPGTTNEHWATVCCDLADVFFNEIESRRKPQTGV